MTVTITKRGSDPQEKLYAGACGACGTEVTYHIRDVTEHDQREGASWLRCPVCKGCIYHRAGIRS